MPRKYRPELDDYWFMSSMSSVYGMFRPIEEKLRAGGYKGPILADFCNEIYEELGENKQTDLNYVTMMNGAQKEDFGSLFVSNQIHMKKTLTRTSEKEFRQYIKKVDNYLDLIIKNTPQDEYREELDELKFHKAYIRMLKVFGAVEVLHDQLAFLLNMKAYDADRKPIKEVGNNISIGITRELWKADHKNYPYSRYRDAATAIINLACDYEENKERYNSYTEQIRYRENYKKALQENLAANKALEVSDEEFVRIGMEYSRREVISDLKKADKKAGKEIDYDEIIKRVEEQEKNNIAVSPEDRKIVDNIKEKTEKYFNDNKSNNEIDIFHSRYYAEMNDMGCENSGEKDFTGVRGNRIFFHEIEAQINAIDMGWPIEELIHIQRLHLAMRSFFDRGNVFTEEDKIFKKSIKTFYDEKIKDKPYPSTEEGRRALYQELYTLSQGIVKLSKMECQDMKNGSTKKFIQWDAISDDIKRTMDKPLGFAERLMVEHYTVNASPVLTSASIANINAELGRKRFGHSNSSEYDKLKKAFDRFRDAFKNNKDGFAHYLKDDVSPDNLRLLEELRESAAAYLNEKDKDKKLPADRSDLGKARYEGAQKAYHLADMIIKAHEARVEKAAEARKEEETARARREMKEVFSKSENPLSAKDLKDAEEYAKREPANDNERYDRFIDRFRTKKSDPVSYEDEVYNKVIQQKRVDDLANMLAAIELRDEGKAFDEVEIGEKAVRIKSVYALDALKLSNDLINGPEKLRNSLMASFRAKDLMKSLEETLYEVNRAGYKNISEAQLKFKKDISTLLDRKIPRNADEDTKGIVNALREIQKINLEDKSLCGINAYKFRKANAKLMDSIVKLLDKSTKMDINGVGPKLALDSLAVLGTYTGCKAVALRLLQRINVRVKDLNNNKININTADFYKNYGIKHSKELNRKLGEMEKANDVFNAFLNSFDPKSEKEHIKAIDGLLGMKPFLHGYFIDKANKLDKKREDGTIPMDDLKPVDRDFGAVGAANKDEKLSNEEFSAVVFASLISKDQTKGFCESASEREKMFKGLTEEEMYRIHKTHNVGKLVGAMSERVEYFVPDIIIGRDKAKEAFRQYSKGQKKLLAGMIAQGIKNIYEIVRDKFDTKDPNEDVCYATYAKRLYTMLRKDPELKKFALKEGLKEADMLYIMRNGEYKSYLNEVGKRREKKSEINVNALSQKEKEDLYIDFFIEQMHAEECLKIKYYDVGYSRNFKKDRKDLFRKLFREYFTENVGEEFNKDYKSTLEWFEDFPKQSIDLYEEALRQSAKIKDDEQRKIAVDQVNKAFSGEVKDFFKEMYGFVDEYERDLLKKYKDAAIKDNTDEKFYLEYAVLSEGERFEGRTDLSDAEKADFTRFKKYRDFINAVDDLAVEGRSNIGRFMNVGNTIEVVLTTKYSKDGKLEKTVNDKDKMKELREDIRGYIRDNNLINENLNKYLSKLENYNKCIVKGRILKADDKTLGDKLEEYKVHKREMQNAQKGKAL